MSTLNATPQQIINGSSTLLEAQTNLINLWVIPTAYNLLLPSDWMVVRKVENGEAVPDGYDTWREEVRVVSKTKREFINSCETKEDLTTYVESAAWSIWPSQPV